MKNESFLKAEILTRGVIFSAPALLYAQNMKAKQQNLCYNAPKNFDRTRPQELQLTSEDGYKTVVSCVAPTGNRQPVRIRMIDGQLMAEVDGKLWEKIELYYVKEPEYYSLKTNTGYPIRKLVNACGLDELNIFPWQGCAVSAFCKFCGVNAVVATTGEKDIFTAAALSSDKELWNQRKNEYLTELKEALILALEDECYQDHVHAILISGNLKDAELDCQSDIYAEIAAAIRPILTPVATEGIVAVITPPHDFSRIEKLKAAGIDIIVFNLEVATEPWFSKYCPGKAALGKNFITDRLKAAIPIFGFGKVWCNFVLGLEPQEKLLQVCKELSTEGIVPGANILHLDHGNRLDSSVPTANQVIEFYNHLTQIYRDNNLVPFYCSQALRTSLANESWEGRME